MVNENPEHSILEYLQKNEATNTFKLAHVLEIKRDILLRILKNLEKQELVRIVTGKVEFLSYPSEKREKKEPKVSKEKSEIQTLQEELEKQKIHIKKLEQKPPTVITRTIIKEAKPIKTKQKKRRKKKKIKKEKTKPKKIKKSIELKEKFKKVFRVKKSFKKLGSKIKEGFGIFKIKNFIKHLKRR